MLTPRLRRRPRAQALVTVTGFDARFDRLWESVAPAFDFVPERRAAYLNWRLADDAVRQARERGCRGIRCALVRHHPYRAALERAGFIDDGQGSRLQYKPYRDAGALTFLNEPHARVHITLGDFDYV